MVSCKVSIILATYNRAHLILETLRSIANQTFQDFECHIIDDGSTDNTKDLVSLFIEQDHRFKYRLRGEKYSKGLSGARNQGLDLAKGKYIVFFDDDDIIHPQNLETTTSVLDENNLAFYCKYDKESFVGDFDYVLNNLQLKSTRLVDHVLEDMVLGHIGFASCTVLWRSTCFSKHRFNEALHYAEEWECFQRILTEYETGVIIKTVLYYNRKHANSNTGEYWRNDNKRVDSKKKAILLMAKKGAFYEQLQVPYRPKKRALIHDLCDFKGVFNS